MRKLRTPGPSLFRAHGGNPRGTGEPSIAWAAFIAVFCLVTVIAAPAQTFTSLFSFDGSNGSYPYTGSLVQGIDGQLYGMTNQGDPDGCGTAFKITPAGSLTTLFNFSTGSNGCNPLGGLMLASGGNIYGSTFYSGDGGGGTLWTINPAGTLSTLYAFNYFDDYIDGASTFSALAEAPNGIFYGTAVDGGHPISEERLGGGVIFEMTPSGAYSVIHFFDFTDGWFPQDATLIRGTDGSLYGEMSGGGTGSCTNGCGVLYKIEPLGGFTVLHDFNGPDGEAPLGGLIQASDQNFYGITYFGGAHGYGTVFKLTPKGTLTTLYNFPGTAQPRGKLMQATDGNLYGTTFDGARYGYGSVFRITTAGKLTTVHNFDGTDGNYSRSGLVQDTNGILYGETLAGGASGKGNIYSLSMGLGPFVSFILNAAEVGQTAEILGQGFTGTTAVSFNGIPAAFTVQSDTYLTATVPAGATTGFVTVTEPSGTLTSNTKFRVIPQVQSFTPTSGPAGTVVVITGESFTGATEVELDCKWQMTFTVDSDTQITATIPANGTTGEIGVFTAGGFGQSAAKFTVTP